eukprot:371151-Prorocentrum_minimum.AAC.1
MGCYVMGCYVMGCYVMGCYTTLRAGVPLRRPELHGLDQHTTRGALRRPSGALQAAHRAGKLPQGGLTPR